MTTLMQAAPPVNPVTPADVRRARYFGLTIPPLAEAAPEVPASNPRDSWPAWTDADTWTVEATPDDFRPSAAPDPEPAELDQAEWLGMSLRLAGEPMAELLTNSTGLLLRFAVGQCLGLEARLEADRIEHDRDYQQWLDRIALDLAPALPREADGYPAGYCS